MPDKQIVYKLALHISRLRPTPNTGLEQFLMTAQSMTDQVLALRNEYTLGSGIVMIGDDDHISLLLAAVLQCQIDVYEVDPRIVASINNLAVEIGVRVRASLYDVRDPFPHPKEYTSFYINPPYSSKTRALGVKVWITRALEGCIDACEGVLILPNVSDLGWTSTNLLEVQLFLAQNGCVVTGIGSDIHAYADTNDPGLLSTNFHIRRVDPTKNAPVDISRTTRIYR